MAAPTPQCFTATVHVTVQPNVVAAGDDSVSTRADEGVTVTVRGDDTSASGQPLATPVIITGPARATAVVNDDGTVTYTPAAGFSGNDSFLYRVCDTSHPTPVCDTATVTVVVAAPDVSEFDLRLTNRIVGKTDVIVGDRVGYRLQVANRGPDAARQLVLKDTLPDGLELVSTHGPGWSSARGTAWACRVNKAADEVTCTLASLAPGEKAPPVVVVARTTRKAVGNVGNVVNVRAAGDTASANNHFSDGPFVESKEYLAGFWVVEADDLDAALQLSAGASKACNRKIEVRPFDGLA